MFVDYQHGFMQRFSLLVKVGIFQFFIELTEGGFHVTFLRQIFLVLYRHCPRTKKAQKLSQYEDVFSEVFTMRGLKRYFNRRSTKAAVAGSSRGHISAARTDPNTPDPPDRQHFLSQALLALVWSVFTNLKKSQSIQSKFNA